MRLGEVKMPCPCLGSNISIVQTKNERFLEMRKGIRMWDAVNVGESVAIPPLPK